ncbi:MULTISPECIES: hypothetical protein [Comamonas]|uniref:hypothetical protein n=1 Tax=Comamonas TaxID=283 RepID=UPI0015FB8B2A|nr:MULTISPECIES: hypothetical protein [Comamonas]UUC94363.1 hypothetical protein NOX35_03205 [Comamonas sp. C11]WEE78456.1 hypothetical protein LZ683_03425 [Comamonas testosteroni]
MRKAVRLLVGRAAFCIACGRLPAGLPTACVLRKRGLFRSGYQSSTLRGHFGLPDLPVVQHKAQAVEVVA